MRNSKVLAILAVLTLLLSGCGASKSVSTASAAGKSPEVACEVSWRSEKCFFGQTAIYEDKRRGGDLVRLEIRVEPPKKFTPSKDAHISPHEIGGDTKVGPDSVYFTVSIKNIFEKAVLGQSDVLLDATSAKDSDYDVRTVNDGDIQSYWEGNLKPGWKKTIKIGWNFTDSTKPQFDVRIDGLSGRTATFTEP